MKRSGELEGGAHPAQRTRRDFLKYGGAAAVGLMTGATLWGETTEANASSDGLSLGEFNQQDAQTTLEGGAPGTSLLLVANNAASGAALHGDGENGATGVVGTSAGGPGLHGISDGDPPGVLGESNFGTGVEGFGPAVGVFGESSGPGGRGVLGLGPTEGGIGVRGEGSLRGVAGYSIRGAGVEGASEKVEGVGGTSAEHFGVVGFGGRGGVRGIAEGDSPGVLAESGVLKGGRDGGLALQVVGQARFSNAGQGTVPAGQNQSAPITPPNGLSGPSHIMVTLTGNPRGIRTVQWVDVREDDFIVHLTPTAPPNSSDVTFTYLVVELPRVTADRFE